MDLPIDDRLPSQLMAVPFTSEVWSEEQQKYELKRRIAIARSDMNYDPPSFKPNPDDVIVAVPPKNGMTWILHICHQIRMQGQEPDFEDQIDVLTWIEGSEHLFRIDPAAKKQPAKPHIFFTHLTFPIRPAGGRQVYCFRDQADAVVSAYYYFNSGLLLRSRVSLSVFAQTRLEEVEKRLRDLVLWWEHRHDDDILLLFFDDLKEDHKVCVQRIAKFMQVKCDEDVIARVVHTTSHAEMARHSSKFHTRQLAVRVAEEIGEVLPHESETISRVRKDGGKSGEGRLLLSTDVQQSIDQLWQNIVGAKLGFKNLNEMRDSWKREQT